jgi:ketosteroid isomerase-like protein
MDFVALSDRAFDAYNKQDFAGFLALAAPNFHYIHYHRGADFYEHHTAETYVGTVRKYATGYFKERKYEAYRTTAQGNVVAREAWFSGSMQPGAAVDALAEGGQSFKVGLVSFHSFDDDGKLLEWKDYG